MTQITEKGHIPDDYYRASLENGSLQLTPHCSCGNSLDDDYFCEKCQRKCRCSQIICPDQATLDLTRHFIRNASQFSGFKAILVEKH